MQPSDIEQQAKADIEQRVVEINQTVNGWVYGISQHKYEAMVKTQEDLLKPLETE